MTVLARLVASEEDYLGYITYVFECLDKEIVNDSKYFFEVQAGIDKWFDGSKMIPYKYSGGHFIKFIKKPDPKDYKYIM